MPVSVVLVIGEDLMLLIVGMSEIYYSSINIVTCMATH